MGIKVAGQMCYIWEALWKLLDCGPYLHVSAVSTKQRDRPSTFIHAIQQVKPSPQQDKQHNLDPHHYCIHIITNIKATTG